MTEQQLFDAMEQLRDPLAKNYCMRMSQLADEYLRDKKEISRKAWEAVSEFAVKMIFQGDNHAYYRYCPVSVEESMIEPLEKQLLAMDVSVRKVRRKMVFLKKGFHLIPLGIRGEQKPLNINDALKLFAGDLTDQKRYELFKNWFYTHAMKTCKDSDEIETYRIIDENTWGAIEKQVPELLARLLKEEKTYYGRIGYFKSCEKSKSIEMEIQKTREELAKMSIEERKSVVYVQKVSIATYPLEVFHIIKIID